jgi:hypothetical protein
MAARRDELHGHFEAFDIDAAAILVWAMTFAICNAVVNFSIRPCTYATYRNTLWHTQHGMLVQYNNWYDVKIANFYVAWSPSASFSNHGDRACRSAIVLP